MKIYFKIQKFTGLSSSTFSTETETIDESDHDNDSEAMDETDDCEIICDEELNNEKTHGLIQKVCPVYFGKLIKIEKKLVFVTKEFICN